jgi:hypothetical protein
MRLFMSVLALTILPFAAAVAGEGRGCSPAKGVVPSRRS